MLCQCAKVYGKRLKKLTIRSTALLTHSAGSEDQDLYQFFLICSMPLELIFLLASNHGIALTLGRALDSKVSHAGGERAQTYYYRGDCGSK